MNLGDIPNLDDPVEPIVRQAEYTLWGRCPVTDEHGNQCRFAAVPHRNHFIMPEKQ